MPLQGSRQERSSITEEVFGREWREIYRSFCTVDKCLLVDAAGHIVW